MAGGLLVVRHIGSGGPELKWLDPEKPSTEPCLFCLSILSTHQSTGTARLWGLMDQAWRVDELPSWDRCIGASEHPEGEDPAVSRQSGTLPSPQPHVFMLATSTTLSVSPCRPVSGAVRLRKSLASLIQFSRSSRQHLITPSWLPLHGKIGSHLHSLLQDEQR